MSLEFRVSRDARMLEQYYQLRGKCFRDELGLSEFDGREEEQDRHAQIFLAIMDGACIGGVRISSHITLSSQLESLGLQREANCMWERFAIDPAMRTLCVFREFCAQLVNVTRDAGYQNAMVLSSLTNARFYRRCHAALGVRFEIHRHVPHCAQGVFSGLEHYLSVAHLHRPHQLRMAV